MLILLPPSETKRDGGSGAPLDVRTLAYPRLAPIRRRLVTEVRALARDRVAAAAALKLGRTQLHEIDRNRAISRSPTMAVIDRYTGVLYDGLDASSLSGAEREFAHRHVAVHSALFGPVAALDAVPAYRLSHDTRLSAAGLKKHWGGAIAHSLSQVDGLVLDLRSEGYAALGAAPDRPDSFYLRVMTEGADGHRRALNHFNKKAKGEFTRSILQSGVEHASAESLMEWAETTGWRLERIDGSARELALVV